MSDVVDQGKSMLNTIAYARAIGVSPAYPDSSVEQVVRGLVAEVERLRAENEAMQRLIRNPETIAALDRAEESDPIEVEL